jgi:glyoxylase-like metal-dependent hydrolase (beta-lactamase superfamily II)
MIEETKLEPIKIDERTYRIEDSVVRCLLFIGDHRALLVDTGIGQSGSLKELVSSITDKPVMLVITHADGDHIGCAAEFEEVFMHPAEMPYFFTSAEKGTKASAIWEGDVIDLGGRSFEVILIPGHTPGSIALLERENRVLVTGDSVSGGGPAFMFGDVRSFSAYIPSMEKLVGIMDSFDEIYPAHGEFPIAPKAVENSLMCAKKLVAGELTPMDPPFELPAKMYMSDGAGFFY